MTSPKIPSSKSCQIPGCTNPATTSIHCQQHQPELFPKVAWEERLRAFPAELKALPIFCNWHPEERDGKKTKVPHARSNNPSTWISFEAACAEADLRADAFHGGVGVMCDGNYAFIDLDGCIVNGQIELWTEAVLQRTNSYAELSPSGRGLHIFLKGAVSKAAKIDGCEIYSRARFFTVTGRHIPTTPLTIAELPAGELEQLREDIADGLLRPKQAPKDDGKIGGIIVEPSMTQPEREARLERALSGDLADYNGDRSAAVHGALQILARKHQGNAEAMAEEFEASQLCDDWGSKWGRLHENEIGKAIKRWEENGKPKWEAEDASPWQLVRYSTIQAKPIEWMWKGYLAKGKLTMLNGEPSHGKSLVSIDIAARLTCQKPWPDGVPNEIPPSSVLLLTEEEDPEDTIKPRFLAAGGDPAKLMTLNMGVDFFRVEAHTERLRKLIEQNAPDTRLIILDPVSDYTLVDAHKDSEVRPMLTKLVRLAGDLEIAVLGINHLNKKTELSAMHRVSGARAWVSVARLNFLVGKDDEGDLRHLVPLKVNVSADGGSLDYKIQATQIVDGTLTIGSIPQIVWTGRGTVTADDLTAPKDRGRANAAEIFLHEKLADGEWHDASLLMKEGKSLGISEDKLGRTRKKMGGDFRRVGQPARVEWRLRPIEPIEVGVAKPVEREFPDDI